MYLVDAREASYSIMEEYYVCVQSKPLKTVILMELSDAIKVNFDHICIELFLPKVAVKPLA